MASPPTIRRHFWCWTVARALTQSDGAIHIMREIGGFWRVVALGRVLPKSWRDWMYDVLARNRYKWFGRRETCYLPPVE